MLKFRFTVKVEIEIFKAVTNPNRLMKTVKLCEKWPEILVLVLKVKLTNLFFLVFLDNEYDHLKFKKINNTLNLITKSVLEQFNLNL